MGLKPEFEHSSPTEIQLGQEVRPFSNVQRLRDINKYNLTAGSQYIEPTTTYILEGKEFTVQLGIENFEFHIENASGNMGYFVPFPEATHIAIQAEPNTPLNKTSPFIYETYSQTNMMEYRLTIHWEDNDAICDGRFKDYSDGTGGFSAVIFDRYNWEAVNDFNIFLPSSPELLAKTILKFEKV